MGYAPARRAIPSADGGNGRRWSDRALSRRGFLKLCGVTAAGLGFSAGFGRGGTIQAAIPPILPPMFTVTLPGASIADGSVTVGDLYGDGRSCIVLGGGDGLVYAIDPTGRLLWTFSTADAINSVTAIPTGTTIRSAPSLADINGDGKLEVVVSVGEIFEGNQNGGVVAITNDGRRIWVRLPIDHDGIVPGPDGRPDGVVATPAIGDIDNDGRMEIIVGAFDQHVHAWHADGSIVSGWPVFLYDTIWSSPALADIDKDGFLEVITGVDAHDWVLTQQGGYTYALRNNGSTQPGWPQHQDQIVQSSPAAADLDGDGSLEIAVGTGTFYPGVGNYFSVYRSNGQLLWRKTTGGQVMGSPAIGDINGDGALEVVVGCEDGKVYAFRGNDGFLIWTVTPQTILGQTFPVRNPVLGDFDGDGIADVFISLGWEVVPLRGRDGVQLNGRGAFYSDYTIRGTPVVWDLDGDGKLELIAGGADSTGTHGKVYVWKLASSTTANPPPWPMFHRNARHTGLIGGAGISSLPTSLPFAVVPNGTVSQQVQIADDSGAALKWSLTSYPTWVHPSKTSGTTPDTVLLTVTGSYPAGTKLTGSLSFTLSGAGTKTIPVSLLVAKSRVYLPSVRTY